MYKKLNEVYFHYTSLAALEAILKHKTLRLGSSLTMDDHLDRVYGNLVAALYYVDKGHKKAKTNHEDSSELLKMCFSSLKDSTRFKYYSMSFTEDFDNQELWQKYADSGNGVALGIDVGKLGRKIAEALKEIDSDVGDAEIEGTKNINYLINLDYLSIEFCKINYGHNSPEIEETLVSCIKYWKREKEPEKGVIDLFGDYLSGRYKADKWKTQKEIRLLLKDKLGHKTNCFVSQVYKFDYNNYIQIMKEIFVAGQDEKSKKCFVTLDLKKLDATDIIKCIYVKNDDIKKEVENIVNKNRLNHIKVEIV